MTRRTLSSLLVLSVLLQGNACAGRRAKPLEPIANPLPPRRATGTAFGIEYVLLDTAEGTLAQAEAFAKIGLQAAKHYAEAVQWGEMQPRGKGEIDFVKLDNFVLSHQGMGFTELVICLKPHNKGASVDVGLTSSKNASPKSDMMDAFGAWIAAVVERYDGDGKADMPGLRWPVRYVEIGSELSSYQPEPIEQYLKTLRVAYEAAHRAYPDVIVAHAALLTTTAFRVGRTGGDDPWKKTFAAASPRVNPEHGLASMRKLFDHPQLFDVMNFHALGDPYEIEPTVAWLKWEMRQRGYSKPIIISDTIATSYIAWGPATVCDAPPDKMGVLLPPATEKDRCRLAEYFSKLVGGDDATVAWTHGFVAADTVQRATVAAEQGVELIDLAFVADLPWPWTSWIMKGGVGISGWSGAIEMKGPKVVGQRAMYFALGQLVHHMEGYRSIRRLDTKDDRDRVYRVERPSGPLWILWRDPGKVLLPGDDVPQSKISLPVGRSDGVTAERTIIEDGRSSPEREKLVPGKDGKVSLTVGHAPVFVY